MKTLDNIKTEITLFEEDYAYRSPHWKTKKTGKWRQWMFWFIRSGSGSVFFESSQQEHRLIPGAGILFPLETNCTWNYDPDKPLVNYIIFFDIFDNEGKRIEDLGAQEYSYRFFHDPSFMTSLLKRFKESYLRSHNASYTLWLRTIIEEMMSTYNQPADKVIYRQLKSLFEKLENSPEKRYSIEELARQMGCSPDHFTRLCKKNFGLSPKDIILQKRIENAQNMLLNSYDDIATIAEKLGYKNQFFFSRQFKQKTGLSPMQFQKLARSLDSR